MASAATRRRLKIGLIGTVVGFGIFGAACWLALPGLVERDLMRRMTSAGIPVSRLHVARIGIDEAVIENLGIGENDEMTASRIVVHYSIRSLLRGTVDHIEILSLRLAAAIDGDGLSLGTLSRSGGTGGSYAAILQGSPPVTIADGRIDLGTEFGQLEVPLAGTIRLDDGGIVRASMRARVNSAFGDLNGRIELKVDGGAIDGTLFVDAGSIAVGGSGISMAAGQFDVMLHPGRGLQLSGNIKLGPIDLAGASYPDGAIAIDVTDRKWSAVVALGGDDASPRLRAALAVIDPYTRPRLALDMQTLVLADSKLWTWLGIRQPAAGHVDVDLQLDGALPENRLQMTYPEHLAEVVDLFSRSGLAGKISIAATDLAYPDFGDLESGTASFDVKAAEGSLSLTPQSDIRATVTAVPSALKDFGVPVDIADQLSGPVTATATLTSPLLVGSQQGEVTADIVGKALLGNSSGTDLSITGIGRVHFARNLTILDYSLADGAVTISGLKVRDVTVTRMRCGADIAASAGATEGALECAGTLTGIDLDGIDAEEIDVVLDTTFGLKDGRFEVRLSTDGRVVLRRIAGSALAGRLKELTLPIAAGSAPLLSGHLDGSTLTDISHEIPLGSIRANLPLLVGGPKPMRVAIKTGAARVSGAWMRASGYRVVADFPGAVIALPGHSVSAQGLRIEMVIPPVRENSAVKIEITKLRSDDTPGAFIPFALVADASREADRIIIKGRLSNAGKSVTIAFDAAHSLGARTGQARIKMAPIRFEAAKLQPRDLFPALGVRITSAGGAAAIGGDITWSKGKFRSHIKLLLEDVSVNMPQVEMARLNGVIALKSLVPLATEPDQQVAIGLINIGVPLTDAQATFRIEPGPRLVIDAARMSLAGGLVTTQAIAFDPTAPQMDAVLRVSNVDLGRLLELAEINGLRATGRLTGQLPLTIQDGAVVIRDAVLTSTEPGVLIYAPGETPSALLGAGESVSLALQALTDFQYSEMQLRLSREAGGETVALMHVKGRNPDFYGGYPVEFNLNVSGKLDQILDRGLAGYRVPDAIRDKLQEFPR